MNTKLTENKKTSDKNKITLKITVLIIVIPIFLILFGWLFKRYENLYLNAKPDLTVNTNTVQPENEHFQMHVIDVGQGDSILVKCGSKNILIDGGEIGKGKQIVKYLKYQNVKKLDMVIATHPHTDHIGGLLYVFKNIPTKSFMMSDPPEELIPTSDTYENLLNYVYDSNIEYVTPESGAKLDFDGVTMQILWDGSQGSDLNNTSIVLRFIYQNTSFITGGDAGQEAETNIIKNFGNIKSDVLKLGHHGSSDSTCNDFIKVVKPTYAVMSLEIDNSYGFPAKQTLDTLRNNNIIYYRTDLQGTVVFISDGVNIGVKTGK